MKRPPAHSFCVRSFKQGTVYFPEALKYAHGPWEPFFINLRVFTSATWIKVLMGWILNYFTWFVSCLSSSNISAENYFLHNTFISLENTKTYLQGYYSIWNINYMICLQRNFEAFEIKYKHTHTQTYTFMHYNIHRTCIKIFSYERTSTMAPLGSRRKWRYSSWNPLG